MALVNQTLPGLYGGVSQQASELRHDTQVSEMINCMPSIIAGTQKRPPSSLKYQDLTFPTDSFIYAYDRGAGTENYIICINNDSQYRVFDFIAGDWINEWTTHSYLTIPSTTTAKKAFSLSTVGDTTFVVNKTTTVAMDPTIDYNDDSDWDNTFYYWIKRTAGDAGDNSALRYTYYVGSEDPAYTGTATSSSNQGNLTDSTKTFPSTLSGLTLYNNTQGWSSTITSSSSSIIYTATTNNTWSVGDEYEIKVEAISHDSTAAISSLLSQINSVGDPNYTARAKGSVLKVVNTSGYQLTGDDSWGNQASESWTKAVRKLADLPTDFGFVDAVIEVSGDDSSNFDNFYVKYDGSVYKETFKPGLANSYDASTMPHKIEVRTVDNGYYLNFDAIEWEARKVGDDLSASEPSFIGQQIQDTFFYRNRLGFIANDNVILSESGTYYNFWPTTVTSIIDSDPIDVAVDSNKAISLRYATPFNKELLIFGDKAQFVMSANDTLTPKNVSVQQSTAFDITDLKPVVLGPNAYFAIEKENYSGIREYYVQPDSLSNDAADITAHCPNYIPSNLTKIVGSSKSDMLFALSGNTSNTIYVYNFYWQGEEKAQSAWHKWTFDGSIFNIEVLGSNLLIMIDRPGGVETWTANGTSTTYIAANDLDTLASISVKINDTVLDASEYTINGFEVTFATAPEDGATIVLEAGIRNLETISLESNIDFYGINYTDNNGGYYYTSEITLSPIGFATSNQKIDDKRGKFILRNLQLNVDYGSFYSINAIKYNIPKYYTYNESEGVTPSKSVLPSQTLLPSAVTYQMNSDHKYTISGDVKPLEIKIINDIAGGFKINSLDFLGSFISKSRSV